MNVLVILTFILLYIVGGAVTTLFVAKFGRLKKLSGVENLLNSVSGKILLVMTFILWPLFAVALIIEGTGVFLHTIGKAFMKFFLFIVVSAAKLVERINEDDFSDSIKLEDDGVSNKKSKKKED